MCSRLSSQFISLCPDTDLSGANVQSSLESQLHQVRNQELVHSVCLFIVIGFHCCHLLLALLMLCI